MDAKHSRARRLPGRRDWSEINRLVGSGLRRSRAIRRESARGHVRLYGRLTVQNSRNGPVVRRDARDIRRTARYPGFHVVDRHYVGS